MKKLPVAAVVMIMGMSSVATLTINNGNVQTVQAAKRTKIHKCSLWAFNESARTIDHITAWKKAHKVIHSAAGTFTFNRLYYFPKDHKWEVAGPYKTKAKARRAMMKAIKEDEESARENAKMEQEDND